MPIQFEEIPPNALVPLFYADVVPSQTPFQSSLKVLLIGHQNAGLLANPLHPQNTPYILTETIVKSQFGNGSMLHWMFRAARRNAPFAELWGMAMAQPSGAVAQASITVSTSPTGKSGTIRLLVAGHGISVPVRPADTSATLAARIRNVINTPMPGGVLLPVFAAIDASDTTMVNLNSKFQGNSGNSMMITKPKFGQADSDLNSLITISGFTGGLVDGSLSAALAGIGGKQFDIIAYGPGWGTTGIIDVLDDYLGNSSGTWSPSQQMYGHAVCAHGGTFSTVISEVEDNNSPHVTVMGTLLSVNPIWEWTGAISARMAQHWVAPPEMSRPLQTIELLGLAPSVDSQNWPTLAERQALLEAGVSTYKIGDDDQISLERLVNTYKSNVWGDPDASWRDTVTMFQAQYFVRYMRQAITGAFPRAALTSRETGIPGFASPGQISDVLVHAYKTLEETGLVENSALFANALVVERDGVDASRVNVLVRADFVNQLRIFAALVETNLQFDPTSPVFGG